MSVYTHTSRSRSLAGKRLARQHAIAIAIPCDVTMPPPLPDWSNERVIEFLELYALERSIWDPTDVNHKNLIRVRDAWSRISIAMNTPVEELKSKKRSLMATFRPLMKKKKASIKNGAEPEDVLQPIWFAFDFMESFLGPLYEDETAKDEPEPQPKFETRYIRKNPCTPRTEDAKRTKPTAATKRPQRVTSPYSEIELSNSNINECLNTLNQIVNEKTKEDECDLYAKLLAKKLRKYPDEMRLRLMYKIDGFLLDNPYPNERSQSAYSSPTYRQESAYPDENSCSPVYVNVSESDIPRRRRTRIKRSDASEEIVLPSTSTLYESTYCNASSDEDVKE